MADDGAKKNENKAPNMENIFEAMSEVFEIAENDILLTMNEELYKGFNLDNWKIYQLSRKRYLKEKLNRELEGVQDKQIQQIHNAASLMNAKNVKFTRDLINKTEEANKYLIRSALMTFEKSVNKIYKLSKTQPLRDAIVDIVDKNVDIGLKTVDTKSGRTWGYKEYMEMSVRTNIHNEIVEQQLSIGEETGQVFYICNSFGDCADDHAPYQGKIYYNKDFENFKIKEEVKEQIRKVIKKKKMLSYQDISDGTITYTTNTGKQRGVYLCTRPNCRHRMFPLTLNQVLENTPTELLNKFKLKLGTYKDDKYEASQELRYCERNIRKYKFNLKTMQELKKKDGSNNEINKNIRKYSYLVRKWTDRADEVVQLNKSFLKRDKRREERRVILNDLGVRYEKGVDIDDLK